MGGRERERGRGRGRDSGVGREREMICWSSDLARVKEQTKITYMQI